MVDGVWLEDTDNTPMTWWIRTAGDCVWGAGYIDEVGTDGQVVARPDQVQSLSGHTGVDFVITGEVIWLGPLPGNAPGNPARYSPLRMVIEFDETGNVTLREDREPGVFGPRCPDPSGFCPDPLVLRRTDEDG